MTLPRLRIGSRLTSLFDREVTLDQATAIIRLIEEPENFVIVDRGLLARLSASSMFQPQPAPTMAPVAEERAPVGFNIHR